MKTKPAMYPTKMEAGRAFLLLAILTAPWWVGLVVVVRWVWGWLP